MLSYPNNLYKLISFIMTVLTVSTVNSMSHSYVSMVALSGLWIVGSLRVHKENDCLTCLPCGLHAERGPDLA
jgi:hypothetical protein